MKSSLTAKMTVFFLVLAAICSGFSLYAALTFLNTAVTITIVLLCISVIILFAAFVLMLKTHMLWILSQLSGAISSLIDMRENEEFSVLNDDMLSKLQAQVIKLNDVLKSQNILLKKERDEIKSLVSDISHQLKTPLSNLRVYCGLLQDESLPSAQRREFTSNLQDQLDKLSFLLEGLIKMSRLESGLIQLYLQMESLNETCLAAIRQVYQKAQAKNIEISFKALLDIQLEHDRNWTAEALFNILDNAVKYTQSGGTVAVSIDKYELFARIDAADTGTGLDEAEINNIF